MFFLFLVSIFLFKIPDFYILPFFKNAFTTSQALARILILIVFLANLFHSYINSRNSKLNKFNSPLTVLILIFFVWQSFSVLVVMNTVSFLSEYKDIIFSIIFFFLFYAYRKRYKEIISVFMISSVLNIFYQYILVYQSDFFIKVVSGFIYQKHLNFVIANLSRNRIYTDIYDEAVIPFLFLFLGKNKTKNILSVLLIACISFFALLSDFRTRLVMAVFAIISSIFIISLGFWKKISYVFLFFLSIVVFLSISANNGTNSLSRLIDLNNQKNITSLISRQNQLDLAFKMAGVTIFGVGIGNYYDHLPYDMKNKILSYSTSTDFVRLGGIQYVHDIFGFIAAGTGYVGLLLFLVILLLFVKSDIRGLRLNNNYQKAFIIAFWTIFIYGLFNPIVPAAYQISFWGIRGILLT